MSLDRLSVLPAHATPNRSVDEQALMIPVTLVTGFLGSGKTTLLNGLLRHPDEDRRTRIVLIARELDGATVERLFQGLMKASPGAKSNGRLAASHIDDHSRNAGG